MQIFIVSPKRKFVKTESGDDINKPEFYCMMSFANSKESLIVWSFNVNLLNKGTKNFAQPQVAVLATENIDLNLGKLLTNGLWNFARTYIIPGWEPLE